MVNKIKKAISSLVVLSLLFALFPRSALATWQAPAYASETAHTQMASSKQTVEINSSESSSTEKFVRAAKEGNRRIVIKGNVTLSVQNSGSDADEPNGQQKGRMKPVLFAAGTEVIGEPGATLSFRSPIQLTGNNVSFQDITMKFISSDGLSSIPHREIFLAGYSLTLDNVVTNNPTSPGTGSFGGSESNLLPLVFAGGYKSPSNNNYSIGDHAQLTVINAKDGQTRFQAIYLDHSDTLSAGSLVHAPIATNYTKPVTLNLAPKTEIMDGSKGNVNFPSGIFAQNTERATINFIGESGTSPSVPAFTLDGTENTTVNLTNVSLDTRSTLKSVGEVIIGDKANYSLNDSFSVNNSVNKLTLNAGGTLKPTGSVIIKGDFVGGGTVHFDSKNDHLEIQGAVSGQTALTQFGTLQPGHRITTNLDVSKDAFTMTHSTYTLVPQEKNGKLHWIVQDPSSSAPTLGSVMFKMGTYQILDLTVKLNELQSGYDSQEFKAVCSDPSGRYIKPNESNYELLLSNYIAVKSTYWNEKDSGKYNDRTDWAGDIILEKVSNKDDMFRLFIGDDHKQAEEYTLLFFKPSANIPEGHTFKEFYESVTNDSLVSGGTLKVKLVDSTTPPPTPPTEATFTLEPTKNQYTFGEQSSFTFSSSDTSISNKNVVISCNGEKLAEQTLVNGKATLTYDTQTRKLQPGANTITAAYDGQADAATCTVTILAKPLENGMFADIDAQTFTGNKIEPVVSPTPSSTLQEGDYTVSYRDNVNVGTATATIQAKENGYFSGTADKTFAINKANYGNQTAQSSTKFGAAGQLDLTPYLCAGAVIGTVTVSADQQTILEGTPSIAADRKTLTYQFKNDASAHIGSTAEISIPVTAANYHDYTITVTVTVDNKLPQADFGFPNAVVSKRYHDADFTIPAVGANTDSTVTYQSSKADVAVVDKKSGTVTIKGVGSTIVTATASATADYAETTASYTLNVNKSTIQITANNKTAYVGDSVPVLGDSDYIVHGLRNGETLKTKPKLQYASTPDMSKPGTVTIQISGAAVADGKEACYDLSYVPGTLTISTKPNSGGGSNGGGSNNPPNNSETTQNPDGSVTVTVTKPDGSKVENTAFPNGDKTTIETKKDGSSTTETKKADGTVAITTVDKSGKTDVQVNLSDKAIQEAIKENRPVALPVPPVKAKPDSLVKVNTGSKEKAAVTIPVEKSLPSLVSIIVHEDGTEEVVRKSIADKTGVTFSVGNHTTIKIVDNAKSFTDVNTHWAKDAIDFVSSHELYRGTSETTFSPGRGMTRGMLTMVLHNLENNPKHFTDSNFTDVTENDWYRESVLWAAEKGLVSGYDNGSFGPNNNVSREQVAVMLWRYAGSPVVETPLEFDDSAMVADFAKDAMQWAAARGIISGTGSNSLDPKGTATRAQVATMVMRSMKEIL